MEVKQANETIQEILRAYFSNMYKENKGNKLTEELISGMILKLQGALVEKLVPLLIKKEK